MICEHPDFAVMAEVERITKTDDGPVVGYSATFQVECTSCHEPFCFRGVPLGLSQLAPTQSLDGTRLTAPIHPMSDPTAGVGLLGFSVEVHSEEDR
jgi:hypothetical protein